MDDQVQRQDKWGTVTNASGGRPERGRWICWRRRQLPGKFDLVDRQLRG